MLNFLKNVFIFICLVILWDAISHGSDDNKGFSLSSSNSCDKLVRLTKERLKQEDNELRRTYIMMKLKTGLQMPDELKRQFCSSVLENPDDFFNVRK